MTFCCHGIGISTSHSIAIGKALILQQGQINIPQRSVAKQEVAAEIKRFQQAVNAAQNDLKAIRDDLPADTANDLAEFINTHLLMLEDQALNDSVEAIIRSQNSGAEWALQQQRNELVKVFDAMEDPYLRTRKDDLDHVVNRIQKNLLNPDDDGLEDNLEGRIIIARDLSPSDTIVLRHRGIGAFITEFGGPMSHTAILAKSLDIPAIVGVHAATELFQPGETLAVDGLHGIATASPEQPQLDQFKKRLEKERGTEQTLLELCKIPPVSTDGQPFQLMTNIELPEDIAVSRKHAASAVGLYRTEFLYMNRSEPPTEEEHFAAYKDIIEQLDGMTLTIRTLDLGADKTVDNLTPTSSNPALGLRAIRLCLRETALFHTQLRAILRASAIGPVRLLIPMLTNIHEVEQSLKIISQIKQELKVEGIAFDSNLPIGGMIEVPAAALDAARFANMLDFLSIGTNDLIQYTLAIDRVDDEVNYLYEPLHPAVLQLIKITISAARSAGIPVTMCGEMAGDPRLAGLLAGLGLREFSMQPNSLLKVRQALLAADFNLLQQQTNDVFKAFEEGNNNEFVEKILKIVH